MPTMMEWAEREIAIACKKERGDAPEGEWDYGCACYESALKAYKSLMEDGHSGASYGITIGILKRLLEEKPLTPIEDVPEVWDECVRPSSVDYTAYQCKRKYSLFKQVYNDGRIEYSDVDRIVCIDRATGCTYYNGFIRKLIEEIYPLTMPYTGDDVYKVFCGDCLYDPVNGDFDTIAIFTVFKPDDIATGINRYFKSDETSETGWTEIDYDEWEERLRVSEERNGRSRDDQKVLGRE